LRRFIIGTRYVRVLPVPIKKRRRLLRPDQSKSATYIPVCEEKITFFFARISGMASACIGVGPGRFSEDTKASSKG
jgi:hypothetical protein